MIANPDLLNIVINYLTCDYWMHIYNSNKFRKNLKKINTNKPKFWGIFYKDADNFLLKKFNMTKVKLVYVHTTWSGYDIYLKKIYPKLRYIRSDTEKYDLDRKKNFKIECAGTNGAIAKVYYDSW